MSFDLPSNLLLQDILPEGHISAFSSLALAVMHFVALGLMLLAGAISIVRWLRSARIAEKSFTDAPLAPGELVVHGTVEHAAREQVAVRVEVDQEGSEQESSGSWSTSWKEYNRRLIVRPFYIRHASGQRIRVEPSRRVELIDAMDGVIRVNLAQRVRVAELTPGEAVYAHGTLTQALDEEAQGSGYRGAPIGMVLRDPGRRRMLLSTEPLGARFRRRARLHRRFAMACLLASALANLALFSYWISLVKGRLAWGTVTWLTHTVEKGDDGDVHYYRATLRVAEPARLAFVENVDESLFVKLKKEMVLPVRLTMSGRPAAKLGEGATYHGGFLFLLLLPLLGLGIAWLACAMQPLAWYEGSFNEGESGRLAESQPPPPDN